MKYSIVYSSMTGNTALLAERIQRVMADEDCVFYGAPDAKGAEAELIFVGSWTDKGSCSREIAVFLESLHDKRVFLFGTAGFGGSSEYFAQILSRIQTHLESSNKVMGVYMCQGKMPINVRRRYEVIQSKEPDKIQTLIDNFDRALQHPDTADLDQLEQQIRKWGKKE